jgi:hypothetical protein
MTYKRGRKRNSFSFYIARDGGFRKRNSYSVGYSEALERGLIPDNKTNRLKYPDIFDGTPVEWHHGLGGAKINFYKK